MHDCCWSPSCHFPLILCVNRRCHGAMRRGHDDVIVSDVFRITTRRLWIISSSRRSDLFTSMCVWLLSVYVSTLLHHSGLLCAYTRYGSVIFLNRTNSIFHPEWRDLLTLYNHSFISPDKKTFLFTADANFYLGPRPNLKLDIWKNSTFDKIIVLGRPLCTKKPAPIWHTS